MSKPQIIAQDLQYGIRMVRTGKGEYEIESKGYDALGKESWGRDAPGSWSKWTTKEIRTWEGVAGRERACDEVARHNAELPRGETNAD